MSDAAAWVREQLSGAPPHLLETMIAALPPEQTDVPRALAVGALRLFRRCGMGDGGRADALPLLAADALLTHAFQAQAQQDPNGIESLASWVGGAGELGAIASEPWGG